MVIELETIGVLVGAIGGLEGLKWLMNRKSNSRVAAAEAEAAELRTLKETVQFLQEQLKEKEVRFAEQTQIVRGLNHEVIELTKQLGRMEVELVQVRCEDQPCPFRQPPNAHTQPKPGMTKEEYHANRTDR